jgi:DNA transposition AAA+ family ATPase
MFAQAAGDLGCIYGGAGLGKTVSLHAYADANPNCWIVTMSPAHGGVSSALEEIAETIGLRGIPGRAARLQRELINRFRNTGGLLVIDEAQHLNMRSLEAIRAIHDATGIGLVLCGNEAVFGKLTGGSREAVFAQLFSRLGKRLRLTRPSVGDVEALADYFGVKGSNERRLLTEIAGRPGALRGVVKVLRLASVFAAGKEQTLRLDHLRAAWRDLGGEG